MNSPEREEFYIGYLPKAPGGLAAHLRRVLAGLFAVAVLVALLLVFGQNRFADSFFDFGNVREFEGVLRERPVPTLLAQQAGAITSYAIVAEGKHGAGALTAGFDGKPVKLRGTLIHRDDTMMIELAPNSIRQLDSTAGSIASASDENLGAHTLVGEIVDSKCYLGVMNPGHTKPHRECAVRCISGGIPPLFVARDAAGKTVELWLAGTDGGQVNQQILDLVAEPVEVTGNISRRADQLFLRADPAAFRRLQ